MEWHIKTLMAFLTLFLTTSSVLAAEHGCMFRHIHEAMALNEQRLILYADLTQNRSLAISQALLKFEKGLLRSAQALDLLALPYQLRGIPLACEDFIDMSEAPSFRPSFADGRPDIQSYQVPNVDQIQMSFETAIKRRDFRAIEMISDYWLNRIEFREPRYNCLLRHFLESVRRSAGVAMKFQKGALISKMLIRGEIANLPVAAEMDRRAQPLQTEGVPILCQDIPHIPPVRY